MANDNQTQKNGFLKFADKVGKKAKEMASTATKAVKDGSEIAIEKWDHYRAEQEIKKYKPVFLDDITSESFSLPRQIRIVDYDKRKESNVCADAIGFMDCVGTTKIMTVFSDAVPKLSIHFYPNTSPGVYTVNPCEPDLYINLTEYFSYLKKERIAELRNVARSLGAKRFCILLRDEDISSDNVHLSSKKDVHLFKDALGKKSFNECAQSNSTTNRVSIADELIFTEKQEPVKPKLKYYKNDINIRQLIEMRLNKDRRGELQIQHYSLQCSSSSGIDNETASNLGIALKKLNYCTVDTFVSQAYRENHSVFEYTIEF